MSAYVLSLLAEKDLDNIWFYIAQDSSEQADRVVIETRKAIRRLADWPEIGHVRDDLPDPTLRVWSVFSYLIVYKPAAKPLEVVRIIHGMRDIPDLMPPP